MDIIITDLYVTRPLNKAPFVIQLNILVHIRTSCHKEHIAEKIFISY